MTFEEAVCYDTLYEAAMKCKNGVLWKRIVGEYVLNINKETLKLETQLKTGTYKSHKVKHMTITSPKEREITIVAFRDRVCLRSLCDNILYPALSKSFIYDNMACQKNKGPDLARKRFSRQLRNAWLKWGRELYVLQCDIKGYFKNIDHKLVHEMLLEKLDIESADRINAILDEQYKDPIGYEPGSQAIQIIGLSYLDKLDHYIKEKLRIKFYIRYQDDFIILLDSKERLEEIQNEIKYFLNTINLSFNPKKTCIYKVIKRVLFLGFYFNLSNTGKVIINIDPHNVKQRRKKLYRMAKLVKKGEMTKAQFYQAQECWNAHVSKGHSYHLLQRMNNYCSDLMKGVV